VLRDSGYSESLHSASYEEFVLPSIDKDKTPPPLPPKNTQPQSNSEPNGRNQISFNRVLSNILCLIYSYFRTPDSGKLFCAWNNETLGIQPLVKHKTLILELVPLYA